MMRTNLAVDRASQISGACGTVSWKVSNQNFFFYVILIPILRFEEYWGTPLRKAKCDLLLGEKVEL